MKISNAPGRKMARQIAAKEGGSQRFYATDARVIQARTIKTKKRKKGMCEVGLRKIHAFTMSNKPEISKNKTRKYNKKVKSKKV